MNCMGAVDLPATAVVLLVPLPSPPPSHSCSGIKLPAISFRSAMYCPRLLCSSWVAELRITVLPNGLTHSQYSTLIPLNSSNLNPTPHPAPLTLHQNISCHEKSISISLQPPEMPGMQEFKNRNLCPSLVNLHF